MFKRDTLNMRIVLFKYKVLVTWLMVWLTNMKQQIISQEKSYTASDFKTLKYLLKSSDIYYWKGVKIRQNPENETQCIDTSMHTHTHIQTSSTTEVKCTHRKFTYLKDCHACILLFWARKYENCSFWQAKYTERTIHVLRVAIWMIQTWHHTAWWNVGMCWNICLSR